MPITTDVREILFGPVERRLAERARTLGIATRYVMLLVAMAGPFIPAVGVRFESVIAILLALGAAVGVLRLLAAAFPIGGSWRHLVVLPMFVGGVPLWAYEPEPLGVAALLSCEALTMVVVASQLYALRARADRRRRAAGPAVTE